MKIGKLTLCLAWSGFGVIWLEPKAQGTWHFAASWANPSFQCGAITARGFGGLMGQWRKAPNGKRVWGLGAWA